MATRYWVGGTASWTNNNTHWSATSGGAAGASFPTAADDVVFDANSGVGNFTCTLSALANPTCRNFTMTNCTGTITGNPSTILSVWGTAFTLDPTGTFDPQNYPVVNFVGTAGCNITCSAQSFGSVNFNGGNAAVYNLLDDFLASPHGSVITLNSGTFNANGHVVNVGSFIAATGTGAKTVNMGSGRWYLSGNGLQNPNVWFIDPATNLNASTAQITLTSDTVDLRTFNGGNKTYNKLTLGLAAASGTVYIKGSNTFTQLDSLITNAINLIFDVGATNTFGSFTVQGYGGNFVTLTSNGAGQTTLVKTNPTDYWYMGANSVNAGNNTNLIFASPSSIDYLNVSNILGFPAAPTPPANTGNFFMLLT